MTSGRLPHRVRQLGALLALAGVAAASVAADATPGCTPEGLFPGAIELRDTLIPSQPIGNADIPFGAVFAPASWTTSGGVTLSTGAACQPVAQVRWSMQSVDQTTVIGFLPATSWVALAGGATKFVACPDRPYGDAWAYLPDLLRQLQPAAVAGTVRDRRELAAQQLALWKDQLPVQDALNVSAGELAFSVPAEGESPARDGLLVAIVATVKTPATLPETQTTAYANPALLALAPPGQLDAALVEAVRASVLPNPAWSLALERAMRVGTVPGPQPLIRTFKPDRPAQEAAPACARGLRPLTIPNLWIAADGRYYFKEATRP